MFESILSGSGALLRALLILAGAVVVGLIFHWILFRILRSLERRRPSLLLSLLLLDGLLIKHARAPLRLLIPLVAVYFVLPLITVDLTEGAQAAISHAVYALFVVALAWLFVRLTVVMQQAIERQYDIGVADNLMARKMQTQVSIMRRLVVFAIVFLALSAVLLRFEGFRQLGTGLLASAGIAGIVLGFAAQRTLGNLLAGIQIAITQPIRVDDVVVVEGEWGRIEEITLTYVVVRIWDQRRLVLPISYFIEKPFQNWTRTSAEILGTVYLYVDYTVPFEAVRDELHRLLQESEHWDGNVWRLHATDSKERTVEIRALMSAVDSGTAWELRCEIREKLIHFLQREYPGSLPRIRLASDEEDRPNSATVQRSDG